MHSITFLNDSRDTNLVEKGRESLYRVLENLEFYRENGTDLESYGYSEYSRRDLISEFDGDREKVREVEAIINKFEDLGEFYDYGLAFDFVKADEQNNGYYRYQLSWGGPSDEIRFHPSGEIEYVYLDWFCGVGFDISQDNTIGWFESWFKDCGVIDFDSKLSEELYKTGEIEEGY